MAVPDILRLDQVADLTGISVNTLRYWRHLGVGPPSGKLGRRVVYRTADLEAWLEERLNEPENS
jgi:predicted DNA-binding transcriptional regulator AlpA